MRKELIQTEEPMAKKLESLGWKFIPSDKLIDNHSEPLIVPILKSTIRKINNVKDEEVEDVINYLKTRFFDVEGCKAVLEALKHGVAIKDKETGIVKRIKLIDYENLENNEFIFSRQVYYRGLKANIPDIVLYINGIPIVLIECKKMTKSWKEAYSQIKRYEEEIPELFKYVQISIAYADRAVYFPNVRWLKDVPAYEWQELEFLKKAILLDILRYFVFYREDKGEWTKVLPRYMQYRAANRIVDRAVKYARGEGDRNKGLIWHWQGSGKTLTIIFAAYKLREALGNPTIFFIIDRVELQDQLGGELKAVGLSFEMVESVFHLKKILTHADGKRGIFVTLIHKFREEELRELREELERKRHSITRRRDVIAFVDEGHRSQYGDLAATMRSILKNAAFFAFTGTPIAKRGRDTYATFGYDDEPYLDRYFILDSIRDGFTVKIAYQARLDSEHLDRESLNVFLSSKLEEIEEEYREQVERELKKKLNAIRVILENPRRIYRIARDIAVHYQAVKPFKAIVVAVSRVACVRYKKALDKYLPPEWTEIVMTFNQDDPEEIQEYFKELKRKYGNKEPKEIREEVIKRFKKEESPKILIVTDMLLTGFDAPILQTMYLDKLLKEHRLLQAIARTNRPLFRNGENVKAAGLIIDYIGIFGELEKALATYDEADIVGVAYDVEEIKEELSKKIEEVIKLGLPTGYDRGAIDAAIIRLEEKEVGEHFKKLYREIRNLYRLLIEDRLEFKERFDWLTEIYYAYHRKVKGLDPEIEQKRDKFLEEALKFIHETIDIEKIRKDFSIVEINEEFLKRVAKEDKNKGFYDLLFAVRSCVERGEVIDEDVVERVERIVREWREREKNVEELYGELDSIVKKIHIEKDERRSLGLGRAEYEILKLLRRNLKLDDSKLVNDAIEIKKTVEDVTFPGWSSKSEVVNEVSQKILLYLIRKYRGEPAVMRKLKNEMVEMLKKVI